MLFHYELLCEFWAFIHGTISRYVDCNSLNSIYNIRSRYILHNPIPSPQHLPSRHIPIEYPDTKNISKYNQLISNKYKIQQNHKPHCLKLLYTHRV